MSYNMTPLERIVLESLQISSKTLVKLSLCTNINECILNKVLTSLMEKNLILQSDDSTFSLNKSMDSQMIQLLQKKIEIKYELLEVLSEIIDLNDLDDGRFFFKKVILNKDEEIVYKNLAYQLETFINNIQKKDRPLSEGKVILWGEANYGKIINSYIHS